MKKFLILILLLGISHSIAYCQTDSLRCFTVSQQNEIITKLIQRIEFENENKRLNRLITLKDSTITDQYNIIRIGKEKFELAEIVIQEEKRNRLIAEKEATKFKRRAKILTHSTILLSLTSIGLYLFK